MRPAHLVGMLHVGDVDPRSDNVIEAATSVSDGLLDLVQGIDRLCVWVSRREKDALCIGSDRTCDEDAISDSYSSRVADLVLPWCSTGYVLSCHVQSVHASTCRTMPS